MLAVSWQVLVKLNSVSKGKELAAEFSRDCTER